MEPKNELKCDFCGLFSLNPVYTVPNSTLGMIIYQCLNCGLYQSISTKPKPEEKIVSTSSGPDWGNIRYGKEMRLDPSVNMIKSYIDIEDIHSVLDIGSSRGHFIRWANNYWSWDISAVEPDLNVVDYLDMDIDFHGCRFEDARFEEDQKFDLVYCCHTLEHAKSASAMVGKIYGLINNGRYIYVEVPDVTRIWDDDITEEFFIDKHNFHFTTETLERLFYHLGFVTVELESDGYNLQGIFQKVNIKTFSLFEYASTLGSNRKKMEKVAEKINDLLNRQRVAIWGAGRQFDALVKAGLEADKVGLLVDEYIGKYVDYIHSCRVYPATELKRYEPDVILVCARASEQEIADKARKYCNNVITLKEMMEV